LGILFVALSVILFLIKLPTIQEEGEENIKLSSIFKFKHTILGALGVFFYLGAEVGIVSFLIRYAKSLNISGLGEQKAALFITLYMGLVLGGRLLGAYLLQKFNPAKMLVACASGAIILVTIAIFTSGYVSIYALSIVGLCTSVMYPILFTLSIKNLGAYTKTGSSLIIMSIAGGAVIPPIMGLVSDYQGIRMAFVLPILCYIYVLYYGRKGYIVE
jgi:MFS transporter, FHS family, L-fucose permease